MSELSSSITKSSLLRSAANYVSPSACENTEDYEQLKKRAREEREAQLAAIASSHGDTGDMNSVSKMDESGYI